MNDRTSSELAIVVGLWNTLDDLQLIKDVVMKGKFISNAVKFISDRNRVSIEEAKDSFFKGASLFVNSLIKNKQIHRAVHVLKNVQLNEFYYFFDYYQEEKDETIKDLVYEHLLQLKPDLKEIERTLKIEHNCYKLLVRNFHRHLKYLDLVIRSTKSKAITSENIHKIIFGTFMKQSQQWKNEMAVDVFFKSKNIEMRHIIDKNCFFEYLLRIQLYGVLKQWLQESYLCKAGKMIQSTVTEPETFEGALLCLFREWKFEEYMMEMISRREKDVIKNEFAKLGLFESRERKVVSRMLNRFFSTNTFRENYSLLKTEEITKFIIENNFMDLLSEAFIDFRYIRLLLENLDVIYMRDELVLIESMRNLLSPTTNLEEFRCIMNTTTDYIYEFNKDFDRDNPKLNFINETLNGLPAENFKKISHTNNFTKKLMEKLNNEDEKLPEIEDLLEHYHSISLDIIREDFKRNDDGEVHISFDDPNMSAAYADNLKLTFINYVVQHQGSYASYLLIKDIVKNFMTFSTSQIIIGCEEIAKLALDHQDDRELISHAVAFLEILSIDSRYLRCLLKLTRLTHGSLTNDESDGESFEMNSDNLITLSSSSEENLRNVEALEVFWKVRKSQNPFRSYLKPFIESNDWFRIVLLAQYLNYSLESFTSICDQKIRDKSLKDNLMRAVMFDSSTDFIKTGSFNKKRRVRSTTEVSHIFANGKFLEMKRDLFGIILKCDETTKRHEMTFEVFQKMILKMEESNDLLFHAFKNDWPLIAVIAATTKLYRFKFCWISWLILRSDFTWNEKYKTIEDLAQKVVYHCLEKGFVRTLNESVKIFYPQSALKVFTKFLWFSNNGSFERIDSILKHFIVKLRTSDYNLVAAKGQTDSINFAMCCIIKHLQLNLKSILHQEKYLEALCRLELAQFSEKVDFVFLKKLNKILERTNIQVNFQELFEMDQKSLKGNIETICESLIESHQFEVAIEVADLLDLPKADFVFKWWIHMWSCEDQNDQNFDAMKYMKYVTKFNLNVEVVIKFLKTVIVEMEDCEKKFNMMKFILRNNPEDDSQEMDALEYEIILVYLRLKTRGVVQVKPLMSEYYDEVISKEKSIIHNSLYELKSIAKIEELTISFKTLDDVNQLNHLDELIFNLLDVGDVIQVMRIQEMFGRAPEDLKLLVYMMSIAEGINSIYDITKEERKTISSYGLLSKKFNRLTLRSIRTSSVSTSLSSSPEHLSASANVDESKSRSYRENKESFEALQGLVCKMKHGVDQAQRIALIYRVSLFLNQNYVELLSMKNSFEFLELAASIDCENKLLVMNDIMVALQMTDEEMAEFIGKEIAGCIIRTRFVEFNKELESMNQSTISSISFNKNRAIDDIWGLSLSKDLHLILELSTNTFLLGMELLKYYKILSRDSVDIPFKSENPEQEIICQHLNRMLAPQMMSLKKQNIIRVELLTTAHECFCHECSTEGIGAVLNLAKNLCNHLTVKKNFNLIVKLMCGIGRFREMSYCFEILIRNDQFEALLVKITKIGKILTNQPESIELPYLKCDKTIITSLNEILVGMIHATELITMANKIDMSLKFASFCELIAVQIHLIKVGMEKEEKLCPSLVNPEQSLEKFQYFANYELIVPQTMILMKNTETNIDFAKAISVHLMLEDESFLNEFMARNDLTDEIIENVVKMTQLTRITPKQEKIFNDLVRMVADCGLKYRLASLLGLKSQLQQMLNDQGTYCYLLDTKYGTVDIL
ncbi:CLUMA_CG015712, isoform A [Clunio marinus]|uniref:CLUMA_CG015712, isoform A n=1 Tax=Clunio marinus TaxID=568069 RepID=A0A1J1INR4_9DIPT|nr:CLUMA_CG015712, isoform A [Clunio marinus]